MRNVEYLGLRDEIKRFLGRWWRLWIAGGGQVRQRTTDAVEEEEEEAEGTEAGASRSVTAAADREAEGKEYARPTSKVQTGQGLVDADELAAMLERV